MYFDELKRARVCEKAVVYVTIICLSFLIVGFINSCTVKGKQQEQNSLCWEAKKCMVTVFFTSVQLLFGTFLRSIVQKAQGRTAVLSIGVRIPEGQDIFLLFPACKHN
jgi:hypothetical protein